MWQPSLFIAFVFHSWAVSFCQRAEGMFFDLPRKMSQVELYHNIYLNKNVQLIYKLKRFISAWSYILGLAEISSFSLHQPSPSWALHWWLEMLVTLPHHILNISHNYSVGLNFQHPALKYFLQVVIDTCDRYVPVQMTP